MRIRLAFLLLLAAVPPAGADPSEPIDAAALDAGGKAAVGLDFRFGRSDEGSSSATLFLFDVQGRVPIGRQFLVHGRIPFELSRFEFLGSDESTSSLGNLEVGGRWVGSSRQLRFGLGGTLGFPTAADEGDSALGGVFASAYIAAVDVARYLPNTFRLGFDASLRWSDGRFFVQGELDLDFLFLDEADDNQVAYLRAIIGALVADQVTLMAGLHNGFFLDAPLGADDSVHALSFGGTLGLPSVDLTLYVFLPLDDFADPWGFGINAAARF